MITVDFSARGTEGLCEFLYNSLKKQISCGELRADERLPSKRALSEHLGVSIITVQNAYAQLISEGYIYSIEKKGFYVSDVLLLPQGERGKSVTKKTDLNEPPAWTTAAPTFFTDFRSNSAALEKFPFSLWAHIMRQVLNSGDEQLLARSPAGGVLELRRAIAKYLREFRGMNVSAEQIVVGAGTESLYSMVVQLLGRETIFAVENPGYKKVAGVFRLNGARCVPVPIDAQGINPAALERLGATAAHVSPAHHFPTGMVMPVRRRSELLAWAAGAPNRFIIEDDYDSEFRFNGKPLATLQSVCATDSVIYMNTFSKTLSPSFRIAYMVLPATLASRFAEQFSFYSCPISSFEQLTLTRFINEGHFEKHIIRMKNYYRNLRNTLIHTLEASSLRTRTKIQEEESGLHFLLSVQSNYDGNELKKRLEQNGIRIALLSDFFYDKADGFATSDADLPSDAGMTTHTMVQDAQKTFVVNYSGIRKERIAETVRRMESVLG